jgi:[ribosomal protein S5]-alanine N-acetyltransferase
LRRAASRPARHHQSAHRLAPIRRRRRGPCAGSRQRSADPPDQSGDAAAALAYIARQHDRLATGEGYSFAIADASTGAAVGQIGLWLRNLDQGRASTGYWVAGQSRNRGYVTAALAAISRWGFSLDGIHRIELYAEPWNEGSWRAAERVGYRREGLLRSWQRVGHQRRDMYVYSLLPHDLPAGS